MLDVYTASGSSTRAFLSTAADAWLASMEEAGTLTWRYYLVRYDVMRDTESGILVADDGVLGYRLCLMRRTQMNSWYRDPFLAAIRGAERCGRRGERALVHRFGDDATVVAAPAERCRYAVVDDGLLVAPPEANQHVAAFERVCQETEQAVAAGDGQWLLRLPQRQLGDRMVDTVDRVELGSTLLRRFVDAGL